MSTIADLGAFLRREDQAAAATTERLEAADGNGGAALGWPELRRAGSGLSPLS